jgi:hypothetical protein
MSDEFDIYGDADTGDVAAAQGDGMGDAAAAAAPGSAGDGLPGYPVEGHPDWRSGVFRSGRGLLGMARTSDLVARPGDDARLMQVSDPVLDWEQNSWRWNDPEALAYDLDRKQRQLAEANALAGAATAVRVGQGQLDKYKPSTGIGVGSSPLARAASLGLGAYMKFGEAPRIQGEIDALQARLNQLRSESKT